MIKGPAERSHVERTLDTVKDIIDKEANFARFPFDGKIVKGIQEITILFNEIFCLKLIVGPGVSVVNRAQDLSGFRGDKLHDVDFTATGPTAVGFVGGKHPEGGPESAGTRQFYGRFVTAVGKIGLVFGIDPARGVLLVPRIFQAGGNFQRSITNDDIILLIIL
jgi:hypothetical protein